MRSVGVGFFIRVRHFVFFTAASQALSRGFILIASSFGFVTTLDSMASSYHRNELELFPLCRAIIQPDKIQLGSGRLLKV